MKKLFALLVAVFSISLSFSGCASYTPSDNETYFRTGEVYRVITLLGEPEKVQNFPLEVIVDKKWVYSDEVITIQISESFPYGSLFLKILSMSMSKVLL